MSSHHQTRLPRACEQRSADLVPPRTWIRKIVDALDPGTRERADELAKHVWVNSPPSASRPIRSAVEEAMAEQRVRRVRYTSRRGATTTRDLEPVMFAFTGGRWYVVAWCHLRDGMRWFEVSRIERAAVTSRKCSGHAVQEVGQPPPNARPVHGGEG